MADFLLIADLDPDRAATYRAAAEPYLSRLPYPLRASHRVGTTDVIVLHNEPTPLRVDRRSPADLVITVGLSEADAPAYHARVASGKFEAGRDPEGAFDLRRDWFDRAPFGFMIRIEETCIQVAADRLGLFPVYYLRHDDILLAASSPSLITCHPAFCRTVDQVGLVGILLYSFPSRDRTIWADVKRLPPGHVLERAPGGPVRARGMWVPSAGRDERPAEAHVEAWDDRFRRWAGGVGRPAFLQLSGGLDSRLAAGYLAGIPDAVEEAWTYGANRDLEVRTAAAVARVCGFRHRVIAVDMERYPEWARVQIDASHMTNAVSDFATWAVGEYAASGGRPVVSGYLGDIIMGGNHLGRAIDAELPVEQAFERVRGRLNEGYGLSEQVLLRLLPRTEVRDLMRACAAELFGAYAQFGENPFRRGWWFDLMHRDRLNVGRLPLQIARFAWPDLPYCRPSWVDAASVLPPAIIQGRRLQQQLLLARFPELAALPLDRGQLDLWPLRYPSSVRRWTWRAGEEVRRRTRRLLGVHFGVERRVNHRLWDINGNPGWRALRKLARAEASAVEGLLDVDVLLQLVPSPGQPVAVADALGGAGVKTLACLVLWAGRHR